MESATAETPRRRRYRAHERVAASADRPQREDGWVALSRPSFAALIDQWSVQPVALVAAIAVTGWYLYAARRQVGWPARRTVAFLIGIALLAWTTCGFPQVYARSLYSVWTAQTLALLLAVPVVLLAGRPLELAQRTPGPRAVVEPVLRSRPAQALRNPLVGPMAVLVLSVVLFFGPLPGWDAAMPPLGWVLQVVLVAVGVLIALPLVGGANQAGSLVVGLALAVGMVELILDAIPGIVLRLETHTATTYFADRLAHPWSPSALHDQQLAGAILWCVAELIDLPFLVLVFTCWVRADRAEAARVDAVLDAERAARTALGETDGPGQTDAPWWTTDPALRDRFRE